LFLQYLSDRLKSYPLYVLPHHAFSRLVLKLTRRESRLTLRAINTFIRVFNVDMSSAVDADPSSYKTFNAFFTRELQSSARPITPGANEIACPADGTISAIGKIDNHHIFQAKGREYSLDALLANDHETVQRFENGKFATVYLSPRDYHRLHMPITGKLLSQTHIPGRLFSVAPHTVRAVPNLFARNERVVTTFATDTGLMALILVGAINVAAIETVWHGLITPPAGKEISRVNYSGDDSITLNKGVEMGRFNMGSTVIVLLESSVRWRTDMQSGDTIRMGQYLGRTVG